ncbi:CinA family protein [soil metagenome]
MSTAADLIEALRTSGSTVAAAESLTGGRVCATLVDVPGASDVVLGGVVAYSAQAKVAVLGVPPELIAARGTVNADVAVAMARAALGKFGSTYAISTTGVAGPGPHEGHPEGTVFIGFATAMTAQSWALSLSGTREDIRHETVTHALSYLLDRVREDNLERHG